MIYQPTAKEVMAWMISHRETYAAYDEYAYASVCLSLQYDYQLRPSRSGPYDLILVPFITEEQFRDWEIRAYGSFR